MRRTVLPALLAFGVLVVPVASAEFGAYGADGWPIAVDGTSTNPFPGVTAVEAEAILGPMRPDPGEDGAGDEGAGAAPVPGPPLNVQAGATVFPYWPILTAEVTRMAQDHPDRVKLHVAGTSTLGLDLYMLEIADFAAIEAGRGLPLEQREVLWIDGGHHSNEYSGVYFALAWAQFLVEEYDSNATAKWIVDNRRTWVMPMVNPDGSQAFGRLNAKGVNINRNYPVIWDGEGHDQLMNNRGPTPASEPETQVNIEWFNITRPDYYASIHCCGNLWLYPYGQEGVDPIDQTTYSAICDEAFAAVRTACGPIWSTIYPASGSSVDTAYEFAGIIAFGYEMSGRGAVSLWGQPLTFEEVRQQEIESWLGVEHAALNVHRYGAYPIVSAVQASTGGLIVTVRNDGLGDLVGAQLDLVAPSGDVARAFVPTLRAGEEAALRVPTDEGGRHEVRLDYAKRLIPTSNRGLQVQSVLVAPSEQAPADGADFFVEGPQLANAEDAPGPAPVVVLALLAALALALRRRP